MYEMCFECVVCVLDMSGVRGVCILFMNLVPSLHFKTLVFRLFAYDPFIQISTEVILLLKPHYEDYGKKCNFARGSFERFQSEFFWKTLKIPNCFFGSMNPKIC